MTAPAAVSRCPRCNCNRWYRALHDERSCADCGYVVYDMPMEPLPYLGRATLVQQPTCIDCGTRVKNPGTRCKPCSVYARRTVRA